MRFFKRLTALVLIAVMCVGAIPVFAAPAAGGTINVATTDAVTGQPLGGVTYKLENLTAGEYTDMGTATSDDSGKVVFHTTQAGWYRVIQTAVPNGYELNSAPAIRYLDESTPVQNIDMKNLADTALYIYRVDPSTNAPKGGARYEVKDNNDHVVATGVTSPDGYLIIPHIAAGEYSITETNAPVGYTDYQKTQNIRIVGNETAPYVVVFAGASKNSITILNLDGATGEPIEGGVFNVSAAGGVASNTVTTNAAGLALVSNLDPNTYLIAQAKVGAGYVSELKSGAVSISDGVNAVVVMTNLKPASVNVYAADATTGAALAGMKFRLYDQTNSLVSGPMVSDAVGKYTFSGLADGNYRVEAEAPDGYIVDTQFQSFTITKGKNIDLLFTATGKGGIQIISADEASGKRLPSTQFRVTKMNGDLVGTFTTNENGLALLPNLENGYYIVEQISVPAGYVMCEASKTVRVVKGVMTPATFLQSAKPFILAEAMVRGTRTPVSNCFFELRNEAGARVATGTTGEDGTYTFRELTPGQYTVNFSYAPNGYTIETASVMVSVTNEKAGLAKFTVAKHSSVIISALDQKTAEPIVGAIFQIRNELGEPKGIYTTQIGGTAVTDVLTPGKYYIQQLYAPDGYLPLSTSRLVTVSNNQTTQEVFTNARKSSIIVYAGSKDGEPLANVPFQISDAVTGKEVAKVNTNSAGLAALENVAPGIYVVEELTVPANTVLVVPIQARVHVGTDAATYVNFFHIAKSVILMQTADIKTGDAVGGASYQVTTAAGDFIGDFEADENGEAVTGVLEPGTYYVKQTSAPSGYLLNTVTRTVYLDKDKVNETKFFNAAMTGIVLEAVSQHDHKPLAGCAFEIYNESGKQVFHGTTDSAGLLNTGDLEPGNYTIKQVSKPERYSVVQPLRTVAVTTDAPMVVVFENVALRSLYVELLDESTRQPLENGRFKVEQIGGDYVADLVTGKDGTALVSDVPVGSFMVHQEAAPSGYLFTGTYQWAQVDSTADTHLTFTNSRISGLILQALMLDGHDPVSGVAFEVYALNGKLMGTYTSDVTGVVQVSGLEPGEYLVKEVKCPDILSVQTATQRVKITTDEPTSLNFYHTGHSSLTISKKDADGKPIPGVGYRVEKANGYYVGDYVTNAAGQVVISALAPGEYRIYETNVPSGVLADPTPRTVTIRDNQPAVADFTNDRISGLTIINTVRQTGNVIRGSRFKITNLDGSLVGNYTTDSNGRVNAELKPGTYIVAQIYVSASLVRNSEVFTVVVKANVQTMLEVENDLLSAIRVRFVEKDTQSGIYGVKIEIRDSRNNRFGELSSDNDGYIYLDEVLSTGSYKLSILKVPDGYTKDTVTKTIRVNVGETTDVKWELTGIKGQIRVLTYSGVDSTAMNIRKNTRLNGAVYQILNANGRVIKTISTNGNGEAYSGTLSLGTYYIQQIAAPAGFLLNSTRVTVNVTAENRDVTLDFYNAAGSYDLTVNAGGVSVGYAGSQTKFFFSNVRGSTTTPMQSFFLHFNLPTDALRAGTLYTGTWNFATTFSIQYKTNLRDYTTLAGGLNSKSQYSYDLSSTALGLSSNEYVTDVRMVFTNVAAGFHENMAPSIYCTVLASVPTGYQYTLRAEVGGLIDGMYYTGASQFTGMAVNNLIFYPLPWTLPKTGY